MNENIVDKDLRSEMQSSFLQYAMTVIKSRALPDARDGLKPVHRRIIFSMLEENMGHNKSFYKSARIVGNVIGKYHPHGDSAVYEALVRLGQAWNMMAPLIEGQGNFGSIDGDNAAAMRYTEARMSKLTDELVVGLKKGTVDFRENYDGRNFEPVVLPARFPNLLVNGTQGIAVGMASSMAPHNLSEVIDGVIDQLQNPEITIDQLMEYIKSPDFPTGGSIYGTKGIEQAYKTGRGSFTVRGSLHIEEIDGSPAIVITQVPYQVSLSTLRSKIREIQTMFDEYKSKNKGQKNRRFYIEKPSRALDFVAQDGINDETEAGASEHELRLVIELKKGVNPNVVINHLYRYTPLQSSFSINNTALIPVGNGKMRPKLLNLKELIDEFIKHQKEIVVREAKYDYEKKEKTYHQLSGLMKALKDLDRTLKIIRQSDTDEEVIQGLINLLRIDEEQAKYILDRRIRTITNSEQSDLKVKLDEITSELNELKGILEDDELVKQVILKQLANIKEMYGQERRTKLYPELSEIVTEDLIQNERIVVTLSNVGYIKSTKESHYRTQRRNGRGVSSMQLDDDDFVKELEILYKHDTLLLFTNKGKVFSLKGYDIPDMQSSAKGIHIFNILPGLEDDEQIQSVVPVRDFSNDLFLFFSTSNGIVKKTPLSAYKNIHRNGILAINLDETDQLVNVSLTNGENSIVLVTRNGQAIKFAESSVRDTSRNTMGVKGIDLREGDVVISADIDETFGELFIVTELGYGKRTSLSQFKLQKRGGVGSKAIKTNDKTGKVIGSLVLDVEDVVYVLSSSSSLIKLNANSLSAFSRKAQGTKVINLRENDTVQTIARLSDEEQEPSIQE
ncbi:DNA topoisomerase (ATP-hydrolyzing) [Bacillus sp. Brlt_9]|uniref:DNA topoisomerase (ATP-hydrolyzing) n=1 Tax=Bacillus sp. Brlt_9 TaxID=3110916 RepID=UPI003F7C08EA